VGAVDRLRIGGRGAAGAAAAVSVALAIVQTGPVAAATRTQLVSVSSAGAQADGSSSNSTISADGRYVAFSSSASNLVPGDTNGAEDVFVRDRRTGLTTRVSVSSAGRQGTADSSTPAISANGRYVAFASIAPLVASDRNATNDVYVRDRWTARTSLASAARTGVAGDGGSLAPVISADGRYVGFTSTAPDLVRGDTNDAPDGFVRDRATGATIRVTVSDAGAQANGLSELTAISADGSHAALVSFATNLVPGDTNGQPDVFVRDLRAGRTSRVSVSTGGAQGNDEVSDAAISADGRYVAFVSAATNLVRGDTNGVADVFVRDRRTGLTARASVSDAGAQADGSSANPAISADGRFVAFASGASNLVPGDTTFTVDVFVRDRVAGTTSRISVSGTGGQSDGDSFLPALSADGRDVAFLSSASNLVPGDTNSSLDVFVGRRAHFVWR
jgi:TolB protein